MEYHDAQWEIVKHDKDYHLNLKIEDNVVSSIVIDKDLAKAISDLKIYKPKRIIGSIILGMLSLLIFIISLMASFNLELT